MGETGKPSRASSTARAIEVVRGRRPKRLASAAQAAGAPGTVTGNGPYLGMLARPMALVSVRLRLRGDGPLALRPCSLPPCQTSAKASLPMPLAVGSTTVRAAAVAMAASIALPPACSTAKPACAASGCEVATMPRLA